MCKVNWMNKRSIGICVEIGSPSKSPFWIVFNIALATCMTLIYTSHWTLIWPLNLTLIRVELEMLDELPVVHNYGHCGSILSFLLFQTLNWIFWLWYIFSQSFDSDIFSTGMVWWHPLPPLKMQLLWSKTTWMPPEDVFRNVNARKYF